MFKTICLRSSRTRSGQNAIDIGFLAEILLFYEDVRLIADIGVLEQLARQCGPESFMELLNAGYLDVSFLDNIVSIFPVNQGTSQEIYRPGNLSTRSWSLQEAAPKIFQDVTGQEGRGRRLGLQFRRKAHPIKLGTELFDEARQDFADKTYINKAVRELIHLLAPQCTLPSNFRFNVIPDGDDLRVDTTLEFILMNGNLRLRTASGIGEVSPADLLVKLLDVRRDLHFSSLYGGEIATNPIASALIQVKCRELLEARLRNQQNIQLFQDHFFNRGNAIAEAVNSGARTYKDVIKLLEKARKFRERFLHVLEPDANLIDEYYKEVTADTWVEKLPAKTMRWVILAILGTLLPLLNPVGGTATVTALSAADTFLLEKLVAGWRPNQFVEGPLKGFVQNNP